MFNPQEGPVTNEDGKFVFVGRVYGTPSVNEDPAKVQALLHKFPRLNAEELRAAKDGIYTWLLYSDDVSDEIRFVSTEVVSPFEIGTRHQSLAHNSRINANKIYGGGELIKTGDKIEFNLLSGTYSKPIVEYDFSKNVTNAIIAAFKVFFPEAEYDNSKSSYIHRIHTVSNSLLTLYKENGFLVRLFDSENDRIKFSNRFWHIDFNIEYYKKESESEKADVEKKSIMLKLYIENLEQMLKLLEPAEVKADKGGSQTRRRRCQRTLRRRLKK
jgi:hypothetical protein